ncbi:PREDICTED: EF-hand calcium-binding domain-containing protein 14 [Cyprinodon variegatus]|uniref:EF-hand calcium binding domain 14 n=1 Tax=Cyprinodon variegatus TaxID=28743 RepID=A0A3Q2CJH4_CYPVA|nr:PREDICTED: EF-hand calcium-binding domain-containing protein 14 [Cyprinodon variegatus]
MGFKSGLAGSLTPQKKMKKRKELNALIGLGDSKRKKTKKGSGHRLLRTEPPGSESESSSEEDDFNNLNGVNSFGKRSYSQCCSVCYPLFLFIILAACVMASAGLIWMQIALKEDLDSLKEKWHSMESTQKASSSEIPKLNEDLKDEGKKIEEIENGDKGLSRLWSNLTEVNRKITFLDSAVSHLKTSLKSSADLIGLPTTVEELQKSVATIGSTLTSVQHDVETMRASLENQKKEDESKKTMDITDLKRAMSEVNKTEEQHHMWTDEQIHILLSTVADLHQRVASLENGSKHSYKDEAAPVTVNSKGPVNAMVTETTPPQDVEDMSAPLTKPQISRRPRFLTPRRSRRSAGTKCPKMLSLPGVTSLSDLENLYWRAGVERNHLGLTYQDLKNQFGGATPSEHAMACFDDGDRRYRLVELRAAVGL